MKIFKSTNNDTTFIKQLLDVINPNIMHSIINKYSGDYRLNLLTHILIFYNDVSSIK